MHPRIRRMPLNLVVCPCEHGFTLDPPVAVSRPQNRLPESPIARPPCRAHVKLNRKIISRDIPLVNTEADWACETVVLLLQHYSQFQEVIFARTLRTVIDYRMPTVPKPPPVVCGLARVAHGKVISVSVLRARSGTGAASTSRILDSLARRRYPGRNRRGRLPCPAALPRSHPSSEAGGPGPIGGWLERRQ